MSRNRRRTIKNDRPPTGPPPEHVQPPSLPPMRLLARALVTDEQGNPASVNIPPGYTARVTTDIHINEDGLVTATCRVTTEESQS